MITESKYKIAHVGLHSKRLTQNNPREKAFAEQWQKENEQAETLRLLMAPISMQSVPTRDLPLLKPRDMEVAATVIQWLGSNVGMDFLRQVIQSSPEIQRWFKVLP